MIVKRAALPQLQHVCSVGGGSGLSRVSSTLGYVMLWCGNGDKCGMVFELRTFCNDEI